MNNDRVAETVTRRGLLLSGLVAAVQRLNQKAVGLSPAKALLAHINAKQEHS